MSSIQDALQIKTLQQKLDKAQQVVNQFGLDFEIEVRTEKLTDGSRAFSLVTAFRHPNGTIVRGSYPSEDMQAYIDDPAALVNVVADDIFEGLFKSTIREAIRNPVDRAINNVLSSTQKARS